MDFALLIGSIAGILTTVAYLPQALKTYTTKKVDDLSLMLLVLLNVGVLLWAIYGILMDNLVILLVNVITLALTGSVLCLKVRYGKWKR